MEHEFKAKDWVLVRDDDDEKWDLSIFSHKDGDVYRCCNMWWLQCIPYEGNEALIGTADAPEEKKTDGWNVGDKVEVRCGDDGKWYGGEIVKLNTERGGGFHYSVEAECFHHGPKWCRADQLRRPNADNWRPKKGEDIEVEYDGEWRSAVLIMDDRTTLPYRVRLDSGETVWTSEDSVRPAKKKEKDGPYKFGDKVQCKEDGEWMDGLFIMDDHTTIRYLVYLPEENDTVWVREEDIRRA